MFCKIILYLQHNQSIKLLYKQLGKLAVKFINRIDSPLKFHIAEGNKKGTIFQTQVIRGRDTQLNGLTYLLIS